VDCAVGVEARWRLPIADCQLTVANYQLFPNLDSLWRKTIEMVSG
jgi:hypothetical protein